jgi:hypothetical protein
MTVVTLSDRNRFSFTCPIFNNDTELRSCAALRDKVFVGARLDIRRGCQAAMCANKCPAAHIISDFAHNKGTERHGDSYGSLTPVKGKLGAALLDRISLPIVTETVMARFGCSGVEVELLVGADQRIAEQMKTAPAVKGFKPREVDTTPSKAARRSKPIKETKIDAIAAAAMSGDLSAGLNQQADV